jgi:toxin ParE1/3/4
MVIWTIPARDDLKAIFEYIALDSRFYANKVVREIIECVSTISDMPERGRIVPEINEKEIREIFIYSYRLIYQLMTDSITVFAVIHSSRNIAASDIVRS